MHAFGLSSSLHLKSFRMCTVIKNGFFHCFNVLQSQKYTTNIGKRIHKNAVISCIASNKGCQYEQAINLASCCILKYIRAYSMVNYMHIHLEYMHPFDSNRLYRAIFRVSPHLIGPFLDPGTIDASACE